MAKYYAPTDTMRITALETLSAVDRDAVIAVKEAGQQLHEFLSTFEPSREMSLAKTNLEQAVMWAVKSITA